MVEALKEEPTVPRLQKQERPWHEGRERERIKIPCPVDIKV